MFRIDKISYAYPGQEKIFDQFSADFSRHQNILIRGENGCGKSTLLKLLVGELHYCAGDIIADEECNFFYVPQDAASRILGLTIEQDLRIWQIAGLKLKLEDLGSLPLLKGFDPALFRLPLRELSTGTKQAYVLSLALLHPDSYLILDEALPGLDDVRKLVFCNELAKHRGILAISHDDFARPGIFDLSLRLEGGILS